MWRGRNESAATVHARFLELAYLHALDVVLELVDASELLAAYNEESPAIDGMLRIRLLDALDAVIVWDGEIRRRVLRRRRDS